VADNPSPRAGFRWKRWLFVIGILVLGFVGYEVADQLIERRQARQELDEVIAQVEKLDPRWRLEDIESDRRKVPSEENSATTVAAAHALLPRNWNPIVWDTMRLRPDVALRREEAEQLSAELKPLRAALRKAQVLKDQPFGRYPIHYTPDFLSTLVKEQGNMRAVAQLLEMHATLLLHQKEMEKAWQSNTALLNAARSLGDEPLIISTLLRMAVDRRAVRNLERILGQGEMKARHLEERQKALEQEMEVPLFVIGLRGERAGVDHMFTNIETGKLSLLAMMRGMARKGKASDSSWWDSVSEFFAFSMVLRSHATLLHLETHAITAAELPAGQRYQALEAVETAFREQVAPDDKTLILARLLFPGVIKVGGAEQRHLTQLGCAMAGLAVERFRLHYGRWPKSLKELVEAKLLQRLPVDHFSGKPLRLRQTGDGVVLFSVGAKGKYDGRVLDAKPGVDMEFGQIEDDGRMEFRLWDVGKRRKPAPEGRRQP
jgi:hypothetical protein